MASYPSPLLDAGHAQLLVVDMQERLLPAMARPERLAARAAALLEGARDVDVPVIVSEQHPKGLGPTTASLREVLPAQAALHAKRVFSCMREPALAQAIRAQGAAGRRQVVVAGVETHVCVLQTALELRQEGYEVYVAADAAGSRRDEDRDFALERLRVEGVRIVTTEMVLFEWLGSADAPAFKSVSARIKAFS
ncbi:hypothetical protein CAL26_01640 [Bordetella genomosp. 9]|uniref:Isochorismatase-like domain-containing protein n=1 Tax=Bordetella genomosp. 9 TaxID=1416803 RepID=A0A261RMG2_9BORD|nr:isochorismatase family protein [Bordetella genomosp. 9]OZI26081.1 hypothetical protein CAL26_01640 [Bordetella genomosp. 9]